MKQSSKNLKIAVCTHVFESVKFAVYFNHLWCMQTWAKKHDLICCGKVGLNAATARNQIVDMVVKEGCTHLFFIDGDHLMPEQSLDLLLELKDEAMVSGLVCKRGDEYRQVGYQRADNGKYLPVDLPLDGGVYQVHVCAFGCTLINLEHLKRLKKPYFRDTCHEGADKGLYNFRSDINLCEAFHDIGQMCWIDTRVLVGHHGFDDIIYPQQRGAKVHCDALMKDSLTLRKGQEGVCYAL